MTALIIQTKRNYLQMAGLESAFTLEGSEIALSKNSQTSGNELPSIRTTAVDFSQLSLSSGFKTRVQGSQETMPN